jgi:hypothetical protein
MNRDSRLKHIAELEKIRQSRVIIYLTMAKQPLGTAIAEDAVALLHKHLRRIAGTADKLKRLDLFLYSRGGDVSVPWRIVSMAREYADEFNVLVPYHCHSAATMICLGADEIIMARKGELSPIDPTLNRVGGGTGAPSSVSVEDVISYVAFMREKVGITDQAALSQLIGQLATHVSPLTLGTVNRQYSHIRLVARKLLNLRGQQMEPEKIDSVIDTLIEKMYSHGHAIGRREATELGLPVKPATAAEEEAMWKVYQDFESWFQPSETLDAEVILAGKDQDEVTQEGVPLAAIETSERLDVFEMNVIYRRKRQIPPNPQINVNLNLALPPNLTPANVPPQFQQILQSMVNQVSQVVPGLVHHELVRQSPVAGFELHAFGGKWLNRTEKTKI